MNPVEYVELFAPGELARFILLLIITVATVWAWGAIGEFIRLRQIQEGIMPRATVVTTAEHIDLQTVEGGWVELRRLSYGEKLRKDSDAMRMRFDGGFADESKEFGAEIAIVNEEVTLREIQLCVVRHNLDDGGDPDDQGNPTREPRLLDFKRDADIRSLDPRVGSEISELINNMNDFERAATTPKVGPGGK